MKKQTLTPVAWLEIAEFIEANDLDDIYYTISDQQSPQKLTNETYLLISKLNTYTWFIDTQGVTYQ